MAQPTGERGPAPPWVTPGRGAAFALAMKSSNLPLMLTAALTLTSGCKDKTADPQPKQAKQEAPASSEPQDENKEDEAARAAAAQEPASRAKALWEEVGDSYSSWPSATPEPSKGGEPHGAFVHTFFNDTTKAAIGSEGPWPDGSVIVKDNYKPDDSGEGPGQKVIVTIMSKADGTWFWAKYQADGTLMRTPEKTPIAGTKDLGCIDCHQAQASRDFVITTLAAGE